MSEIEQKLASFARWVISEHREAFTDIDGGSIQDKLVELGLLVEVPATEPCSEYCHCVEYGADFPTTCVRVAEGVKP